MRARAPYQRVKGLIQNSLGYNRSVPSKAETGLEASELYCPKCKAAMPVRQRLLLVLPDGELHEYLCLGCGSSLGERTTRQERQVKILFSS